MGAEDLGQIWRQIGAAARAFHTVTFDHFGYLGGQRVLEPVGDNRTHMTRILDSHSGRSGTKVVTLLSPTRSSAV